MGVVVGWSKPANLQKLKWILRRGMRIGLLRSHTGLLSTATFAQARDLRYNSFRERDSRRASLF